MKQPIRTESHILLGLGYLYLMEPNTSETPKYKNDNFVGEAYLTVGHTSTMDFAIEYLMIVENQLEIVDIEFQFGIHKDSFQHIKNEFPNNEYRIEFFANYPSGGYLMVVAHKTTLISRDEQTIILRADNSQKKIGRIYINTGKGESYGLDTF